MLGWRRRCHAKTWTDRRFDLVIAALAAACQVFDLTPVSQTWATSQDFFLDFQVLLRLGSFCLFSSLSRSESSPPALSSLRLSGDITFASFRDVVVSQGTVSSALTEAFNLGFLSREKTRSMPHGKVSRNRAR
jgi:hypothetical protein